MRQLSRVVLLGLLLLAACGPPRGVAATVNGVEIPMEVLELIIRGGVGPGPVSPDEAAEIEGFQRDVLADLIRGEIVRQAAEGEGIEVTAEDVEEAWQDLALQFGGEDALRAEIEAVGRTEAEIRDRIAALVREDRVAERLAAAIEVPDETLRAAYEAQLEEVYTRARAAHILVDTEEEAREIVALLDAGADFAELARERSLDPGSAELGGDLGWQGRGRFVEPFDDAVWAAEAGEVVGPVGTQFGWHVIRVEAFEVVPFEEAAEGLRLSLERELADRALDDWLGNAFAAAEVWVSSRFGTWDPGTGTVVGPEREAG